MKIQTLSLVVDAPCNAACPFCVSRMTGDAPKRDAVDVKAARRNLDKAIMAAKIGGATTALITSKGEPTLNPEQVSWYIGKVQPHFPFVELQTNGLVFMKHGDDQDCEIASLRKWQMCGLTTLAISVVSYKEHVNRDIFGSLLFRHDIPLVIKRARGTGLMVRLTCTMFKGGVETFDDVMALVKYCTEHKVEQLSLGPVTMPDVPEDNSAAKWVREHELDNDDVFDDLDSAGQKLMTLPHGAAIYDIDGVSVCIRECLSLREESDEVRQLIFYPNGRLTYDWQYKGAVLL